jgi:hypothetical protein
MASITNDDVENTCSICLDDFDENFGDYRSSIELVCGHRYHEGCLDEYLRHRFGHGHTDLRCPLCRTVFAVRIPGGYPDGMSPDVDVDVDAFNGERINTSFVMLLLIRAVIAIEAIAFCAMLLGLYFLIWGMYLHSISSWIGGLVVFGFTSYLRVEQFNLTSRIRRDFRLEMHRRRIQAIRINPETV